MFYVYGALWDFFIRTLPDTSVKLPWSWWGRRVLWWLYAHVGHPRMMTSTPSYFVLPEGTTGALAWPIISTRAHDGRTKSEIRKWWRFFDEIPLETWTDIMRNGFRELAGRPIRQLPREFYDDNAGTNQDGVSLLPGQSRHADAAAEGVAAQADAG